MISKFKFKLKKLKSNKKGEAYVDVAVKFLVAVAIVVAAINIFSAFMTYRDMDIMSKEILEVATYYGTTDTNDEHVKHAIDVYQRETGLTTTNVRITTEENGYADESSSHVQLGKSITVTVSDRHPLVGFGVFSETFSVPMSIQHTGLSEVYWK